jgi:hypothetical protein
VIATAFLTFTQASPAAAATRYVNGSRGFEKAVAALRSTGGRVVLLPHRYRHALVVGPGASPGLTLVGERGTVVQNLVISDGRSVVISHLTVAPITHDASLIVERSHHVLIDHVKFTAAGTSWRVQLDMEHSSGVTVRESSFSHCGDRSPAWSLCLLPGWSSHVTIEHDRFHDCRGCDFIHGRAGVDMLIRDNSFARALACRTGTVKCLHQDMIELFAANSLVVSRNRFGVTQRGGAQLYLVNAIDHVRIQNNLFIRTDPRVPRVHSPVGVLVGNALSPRLPHDVEIINNTILSGWRTRKHPAMSILISPRYRGGKLRNRPLVANNILERLSRRGLMCTGARRSIRNVVARGEICSHSDQLGDPHLGVRGRPTAASVLVIDRADAALAPPYDLTGRPRGAKPDIGAYEYVSRR